MVDRWRALAVLTAARTSLGFQFQSIASLSADLIPGQGLSFATLGVLIGLYFLPGVVVSLPVGALSRRLGDKRLVLAGLVLMTLGAGVCAAAGNSTTLAVGRVIAGVGGVTSSHPAPRPLPTAPARSWRRTTTATWHCSTAWPMAGRAAASPCACVLASDRDRKSTR